MRRVSFGIALFWSMNAVASENPKAVVVPHAKVQSFEHRGNKIQGVATKSAGATQFEVWHASIGPKSSTPPHHWHETEEVFIFLKGKGKAVIGDEAVEFEAPCTVILPAKIPHQVFNTGDEPTDHYVVIGSGSKIFDKEGVEMLLPWRK